MQKLSEATRTELIAKSKTGDAYSDPKKGSRWTRKNQCGVSNSTADYNKVDMDTLFKKGILSFVVKVRGETNSYEVLVSFPNATDMIQKQVKDHQNKMDANIVYQALMKGLNSTDVKVSCSCPDWKYRFSFFGTKNGTSSGPAETRASDKTNPDDSKGAGCKHINAVLNNTGWLAKVSSVIANYINYCRDEMQYIYSKYVFPAVWGMPYDKAVQMSVFDYDDAGETKEKVVSDEATLNLSNALGKVRGRYKKGTNRNPVQDKRTKAKESLEEGLEIVENFDKYPNLIRHFDRHVVGRGLEPRYKKFSDLNIHFSTPQAYKESAEDLAATPTDSFIHGCSRIYRLPDGPTVQYCKSKRFRGNDGKWYYTIVIYIKGSREERADPNAEWHRHIITYFVSDTDAGITYGMDYLPYEEERLTDWDAPIDKVRTVREESNVLRNNIR